MSLQIRVCLIGGIIMALLGASCAPQPAPMPEPTQHTVAPDPTSAPETQLPVQSTAIPSLTATRAATATITLTPTLLPPTRLTPPTLMLHRNNSQFNAVEFLRQMIAIIKQNDLRVVTYREISAHPEITATEQGKLFIITIDDLYLRFPIDKSVKEMIALLQEAGYPAVLGVVTETDYVYPETAQIYKTLIAQGWEIASHSDTHANLGKMEKTAPRSIYLEVKNSLDKIEKATGVRPITLILPEGQMVNDSKQLRRAELTWVVGINGGTQYNTARDLFYVGRDGPGGSAEETFKNMLRRFLP